MTQYNNRKRSTYRLTPELDKLVTEKARKLGISKNAFVQITLSRALGQEDEGYRNNGDQTAEAVNQ